MACVFDGIKVLDFGWILVGPQISGYLARHGATIVKVEALNRPDSVRLSAPFKDRMPGQNRSGYFAGLNPNKYGMTLNLKHPKGLEVAKKLVAWADIVTENFAPGVMEGWGLDYEGLKKIKPDIIMIRSSNQGQTGPQAHRRGFGILLASQVGFNAVTGWPDRGPNTSYLGYTDFIAPRFAAAAVSAALIHRKRTGKGQCLDVSQAETALHFLAPVILDYTVNQHREWERAGNASPYSAPHGAYPCQGEDSWCAISVTTDEEWRAFCRAIGNPAWTQRPEFATLIGRKKNEDELNELVGRWTVDHTSREVMMLLQGAGVSAGVVQNTKDLLEDPQLKLRDYVWYLEHDELGQYPHMGPYIKLSRTPAQPRMPAPNLGQHTELVCREFLGMPDEEFTQLLVEGVFD